MANKAEKATKNVSGKYYCDTSCIACGQCVDIAPDYFVEDSENGGIYVKKQPSDAAGQDLCNQAKDVCPVEAIGDDGE